MDVARHPPERTLAVSGGVVGEVRAEVGDAVLLPVPAVVNIHRELCLLQEHVSGNAAQRRSRPLPSARPLRERMRRLHRCGGGSARELGGVESAKGEVVVAAALVDGCALPSEVGVQHGDGAPGRAQAAGLAPLAPGRVHCAVHESRTLSRSQGDADRDRLAVPGLAFPERLRTAVEQEAHAALAIADVQLALVALRSEHGVAQPQLGFSA